jgi:hypothetical protein
MNLPVSSWIPVNYQCADYGQERTQGLRESTALPPAGTGKARTSARHMHHHPPITARLATGCVNGDAVSPGYSMFIRFQVATWHAHRSLQAQLCRRSCKGLAAADHDVIGMQALTTHNSTACMQHATSCRRSARTVEMYTLCNLHAMRPRLSNSDLSSQCFTHVDMCSTFVL